MGGTTPRVNGKHPSCWREGVRKQGLEYAWEPVSAAVELAYICVHSTAH